MIHSLIVHALYALESSHVKLLSNQSGTLISRNHETSLRFGNRAFNTYAARSNRYLVFKGAAGLTIRRRVFEL